MPISPTPTRYRKQPVTIEALRYDGTNADAVVEWMASATAGSTHAYSHTDGLTIAALEGDLRVTPGDYVIRGVQGEHYPCKPDVFAATYVLAEEQA